MIMPVLVLAFSMAGSNIRYIRSAVLEILQQDYLRTARAKGIGRFRCHQQACAAKRTRSDRDSDQYGDSGALWRSSHH